MRKVRSLLAPLIQPAIAIFFGFLAGAIVISFAGESIWDAYREMWRGAFGSFYFFASSLSRATPIILIALGLALAFRAGFFNLGAEGQMVLGGLSAALTALYIPGPAWLKLMAALVAGMAAGGIWSLFAAWMDVRFRVNLLISTLLLNYIATLFASYMVSGPFKDNTGSGALAQTPTIVRGAWLPKLFSGMSLHAGFIIAIVLTIVFVYIFRYTIFGYEVKMLGQNSSFSLYGGVNRLKIMVISMLASGGLAGLAGSVEVLGMQYRFVDGALTIPGYSWTAIMAVLLANSHPLGTAVSAFFLAALQTGAAGLERNTDVPIEVSSVIQAVLILFISTRFGLQWLKRRKGRKNNGSAV